MSGFDGREGGRLLDGEVSSGMLGVDWSRDSVMAGLVVSHSLGEGGYRGESGNGAVSSSLTGLYPWGRCALSERVSVWGVAGYGEGTLTLTPEGAVPIQTDLDLILAEAGLRGVLVQAPETGGFELAVETVAMGVRTSTAKARPRGGSPKAGCAPRSADGSRRPRRSQTAPGATSCPATERTPGGRRRFRDESRSGRQRGRKREIALQHALHGATVALRPVVQAVEWLGKTRRPSAYPETDPQSRKLRRTCGVARLIESVCGLKTDRHGLQTSYCKHVMN